MTYLVLARKWRPRSFDTLVGQDHVVRALTHALDTQRLHHAWLFTGTRGVGKTTLSRILAKSLNCEQGVTAKPCDVCRACVEIDAGRFVDYVELDAASNRGVDEMTQLLEQAVYAPSSGRFKVYMIDEVHMLTGHAFNAMLKTLEEPPPHVKFILATTDPQKIPVTVLSRCLQFNLKQMTAESIVTHLQEVLAQEDIPFEVPALRLIAQAASGSMRDALSLTDQAIAYSAGNLTVEAMQGMLGTIDQRYLVRLLQALAAGKASEVLGVADELATRGLSYSGALGDLAILLSKIAIQQRIPGALGTEEPLIEEIVGLASTMHPDLVQLFYSVAVHSRNELSLAPDEYAGFVMACLRMLALAPEADTGDTGSAGPGSGSGSEMTPSVETADEHTASSSLERTATHVSQAGSLGSVQMAKPDSAVTTPPSDEGSVPSEPSATASNVSRSVSAARSSAVERLDAEEGTVAPDSSKADTSASSFSSYASSEQSDSTAGSNVSNGNLLASTPSVSPPSPLISDAQTVQEANRVPMASVPAEDDIPAWEDIPVDADFGNYEPYQDLDEPGAEASFTLPDDGAEIGMEAADPDSTGVALFAAQPAKIRSPKLNKMNASDWPALAAQLPVTGLAAELARQSEWLGVEGDLIRLRVAVRTLAATAGKARLRTVLSEHFGKVVQLEVEFGATGDETAHAVAQAERAARQKQAELDVQADPVVRALIDDFGAHIVPGSVRAIMNDNRA